LNTKCEYGTEIYRENSWDIVSEESDAVTIHEGSLSVKRLYQGDVKITDKSLF
jgi:hypothetical protein